MPVYSSIFIKSPRMHTHLHTHTFVPLLLHRPKNVTYTLCGPAQWSSSHGGHKASSKILFIGYPKISLQSTNLVCFYLNEFFYVFFDTFLIEFYVVVPYEHISSFSKGQPIHYSDNLNVQRIMKACCKLNKKWLLRTYLSLRFLQLLTTKQSKCTCLQNKASK